MAAAPVKAALEDLLRVHRLSAEAPPLRGEGRHPPLATGIASVDALLGGGFPHGQLSEVQGPPSSGRTGLTMAMAARATASGALAAWVDPADRFDPVSAAEAGVDLGRLLWLRGARAAGVSRLPGAVSATHTLAASGLFDLVVLDLAGVEAADIGRLPGPTWRRLQRAVENQPVVIVLVAASHVAHGPAGVSMALGTPAPRWSGAAGPGRLLHGVGVRAHAGRWQPRAVAFELRAFA